MLIVLLLISIGLIISGIVVYNYCCDGEAIEIPLCVIGSILTTIILTVVIVGTVEISREAVIAQEIEMYQEENTNIENSISLIVENYLQHELGIFESIDNQNPEILVTLYPQIKSNELVQSQIDMYIKNNNKIKELKIAKLEIQVWRWWVYFG